VRATNAVGHGFRERSVINPRRTRHAEERPQRLRIGVETLSKHGVPDAFQALDLRISRNQVVERRLNHDKRAHVLRSLSRGDQGSEDAIRVGDDVRT
jgi:hypothetical protein